MAHPLEPQAHGTRIVPTFEILKLNPLLDRVIYLFMRAHRDRLPALAEDLHRLGKIAAGDAIDHRVPATGQRVLAGAGEHPANA